ncbi:MAG: YybH family protein [Novosphingobium sp.]
MEDLAPVSAALRQLHARYTDAVWRKDADSFAACFAPDGEWRISGMVMRGQDEIRETIARILARMHRVLFTYGDPVIDRVDGALVCRAMVNERVAWADGKTNISIGRYYERLTEAGGRLCFAWRLFELHYRGPPDLTGDWFDHADYGAPPAMPPLDTLPIDTSSQHWHLGTSGA